MGLKTNCYATTWEKKPYPSGKATDVRISVSKKNKQTDQYETEFSGWCRFAGTANQKAASLVERSRIKITDFEVTNRYDKEKGTTYTNVTVWDFEPQTNHTGGQTAAAPVPQAAAPSDDDTLPF